MAFNTFLIQIPFLDFMVRSEEQIWYQDFIHLLNCISWSWSLGEASLSGHCEQDIITPSAIEQVEYK